MDKRCNKEYIVLMGVLKEASYQYLLEKINLGMTIIIL